jgi:hypothetical protein
LQLVAPEAVFGKAVPPFVAGLAGGGAHVPLSRQEDDGVLEAAGEVLLLLEKCRAVGRRIRQEPMAGLLMGVEGGTQLRDGSGFVLQLGGRFLNLVRYGPDPDNRCHGPEEQRYQHQGEGPGPFSL